MLDLPRLKTLVEHALAAERHLLEAKQHAAIGNESLALTAGISALGEALKAACIQGRCWPREPAELESLLQTLRAADQIPDRLFGRLLYIVRGRPLHELRRLLSLVRQLLDPPPLHRDEPGTAAEYLAVADRYAKDAEELLAEGRPDYAAVAVRRQAEAIVLASLIAHDAWPIDPDTGSRIVPQVTGGWIEKLLRGRGFSRVQRTPLLEVLSFCSHRAHPRLGELDPAAVQPRLNWVREELPGWLESQWEIAARNLAERPQGDDGGERLADQPTDENTPART